MKFDPVIRPATVNDSADLTLLADAATRRLFSWLWSLSAVTGQSTFEIGRNRVAAQPDHLTHFSQWKVAELDGLVAGGLNSYEMPPITESPAPESADVLAPFTELKGLAEGTWYISVASVYPEFRGRGSGKVLLGNAREQALEAGISRLTLMVGSFNPDAVRLYERFGFEEWERRPYVPFPGSDPSGDMLLLVKPLNR